MKKNFLFVLFLVLFSLVKAQENLAPLYANINYMYGDLNPAVGGDRGEVRSQRPVSLFLPFVEDFSYAGREKYPRMTLWEDSNVYVNTGYPISPPSFGVATFDGLNKHGYPYDNPAIPNLQVNDSADVLTSRPINLFTSATNQTLTPADSVRLSFHYQARGYGEPPEAIDSLILDLFNPTSNEWIARVWHSRGSNNANLFDSTFKRVTIKIDSSYFFKDGFRFRFRNKATNSGDFDHWHLDYIYLNQGRSAISDTLFNDVTFAHVPTPFLRDYSAMPWEQYQAGDMSSGNSVWIKNNFDQPVSLYYKIDFVDKTNTTVYTYNAQNANINPFKPNGYFNNPAYYNPAGNVGFTFDYPAPMTDSADFTIKHILYRSGQSSDWLMQNDTLYQYQRFRNYYAFDDGSAEAGYYVNGASGQMVLKFYVSTADTLRGARIYFAPSPIGTSATSSKFRFKLYAAGAGPGTEINVGTKTYNPIFIKTGLKEIPQYDLENPIVLQPGTYYFGIQQLVATGIVIGFDRNYDAHNNLFFNSGSGWQTSALKGALMMRPVMGKKIPPPVGIKESSANLINALVYPNPNTGKFRVELEENHDLHYELYNSIGQLSASGEMNSVSQEIDASNAGNGVFILVLKEKGTVVSRQKILVQN